MKGGVKRGGRATLREGGEHARAEAVHLPVGHPRAKEVVFVAGEALGQRDEEFVVHHFEGGAIQFVRHFVAVEAEFLKDGGFGGG